MGRREQTRGTKRGPKKFTESRRKRCDLRVPPTKPIVRPHNRQTRKRKTEVLLWLIDNRVSVTKESPSGGPFLISPSATRRERTYLTQDEREALKQAFRENGVIYRPPIFQEAETFWKVKKTTIAGWWRERSKFLSAEDYDRSNKLPVYEIAPGFGIPKSAPRPQVLPETPATADAVNTPDTDDDDASDAVGSSPPSVIEVSDDSDIELDDDEDELPELDAETLQAGTPDHPEIEEPENDISDEDAECEDEDIPDVDIDGTA
ncbi:hypothetical protein CIB48_g7655 [Xylaria polymorpha]|nr:hypothetical protein CIB48_g7655 [Xylaria polymorpha]